MTITLAGMAAAGLLGAGLGDWANPRLVQAPADPMQPVSIGSGEGGMVDLTPSYVSPESLRASRAMAEPAAFTPDLLDRSVKRELAQAEAELRSSELALSDYRRTAVAVADVVTAQGEPVRDAGAPALQVDNEGRGWGAPHQDSLPARGSDGLAPPPAA